MRSFRDKVNELREARKLSYEDVAEGIGHPNKSKVQGWLGPAQAAPRLDDAMRVAKLFEVPLEYLADDEMETVPEPAKPGENRRKIEMLIEVFGEGEALRRLKGAPGADIPLNPGNPGNPVSRGNPALLIESLGGRSTGGQYHDGVGKE